MESRGFYNEILTSTICASGIQALPDAVNSRASTQAAGDLDIWLKLKDGDAYGTGCVVGDWLCDFAGIVDIIF